MMVSTMTTGDGMLRLLVTGEIDMATVGDLEAALAQAITADATTAVVADLAQLTFAIPPASLHSTGHITRLLSGCRIPGAQPATSCPTRAGITGALTRLLDE